MQRLKSQSSMEVLDLSGKSLKEKDFKKVMEYLQTCTNKKLNFSGSQLGNKGLGAIGSAICENKEFIEVDLTSNALTPEGILQFLDVLKENNTIKKVDLSGNAVGGAIENLAEMVKTTHPHLRFGLEDTGLSPEELYEYESALTSMKWKNELDTYVETFSEDMTTLTLTFFATVGNDEMELFIDCIKRATSIHRLVFNVDCFSQEALDILTEAIYHRTDVKSFRLLHNLPYKDEETGLFTVLGKFSGLESLEIITQMEPRQGELLMTNISILSKLKSATLNGLVLNHKILSGFKPFSTGSFSLQLADNKIDEGETTVEFVGSLTDTIPSLRRLSLIGWDLSGEILRKFAEIIPSMSINELDLSYSRLDNDTLEEFGEAISKSTIQELYLRYCGIKGTGSNHYVTLLKSPKLSLLALDGNDFSQGMQSFSAGIGGNTNLKTLLLGDTKLNDRSIDLLCEGLSVNKTLESLSLRSNTLCLRCLQRILTLLEIKSLKISSIDLSNCGLSYLGERKIRAFLRNKKSKTLRQLFLFGNAVDASVLQYLS